MKNGVLSIYSGDMQSTDDWWYPEHLLIRDGIASIYSDGIYSIYT